MSLTLIEREVDVTCLARTLCQGFVSAVGTMLTPVDGYLEAVIDSYFLGEGEGEPREKHYL